MRKSQDASLNLEQRVHQYCESHQLLERGTHVLVGISGGVDSVVLLHLLKRLGYHTHAVHVNYQLRGEASDADEALLRAYCDALNVPLAVERVDTLGYVKTHQKSLQEAARDIRYAFFERRASELGGKTIAVAHHLDDQVETVLLQLFRGSGPEGLQGMRPKRPLSPESDISVVRPLLSLRRSEILDYARREQLAWNEDETNESQKYRRSAIRQQILPLIEEHFGKGSVANVARSANLLREYVEHPFNKELRTHLTASMESSPTGGVLNLNYLSGLPSVWQHRVILEALRCWLPGTPQHAKVAMHVASLIEAQPGRCVAFQQGTVWREREGLAFVQTEKQGSSFDGERQILEPEKPLVLDEGILLFERLEMPPTKLDAGTSNVIFVDAGRVLLPLSVRYWQKGDRFRPFGMKGHKKVSDLLTDEKVPPHLKSKVLVVEADQELVWVVGHRLSHEARVRPGTEQFAKISFIPHRSLR